MEQREVAWDLDRPGIGEHPLEIPLGNQAIATPNSHHAAIVEGAHVAAGDAYIG